MDRREPTTKAISQVTNDEVSLARQILNRTGNILSSPGKKLTALATAGVLTLTLAGCGEVAAEPGPKPTTTQSAEATPTPSESAPATTENVTELDTLTYMDFNTIDPAEKRGYASFYITTGMDRHEQAVEGKGLASWTEPSIDMSDQEIIDNFTYVLDEARISTVVDAVNEKRVLDHDKAVKILSGAFFDTDPGYIGAAYHNEYLNDIVAEIGSYEDGYVKVDGKLTASNETTANVDDVDHDGQTIPVRDIAYTTASGAETTTRFAFVEDLDGDGPSDDSGWLYMSKVN